MSEALLRAAMRLFRSDSRRETYLAVGIVTVVLAPTIFSYWKQWRGGGR